MPAMESKSATSNTVQNGELAEDELLNNVVKDDKENHKNIEDSVSIIYYDFIMQNEIAIIS